MSCKKILFSFLWILAVCLITGCRKNNDRLQRALEYTENIETFNVQKDVIEGEMYEGKGYTDFVNNRWVSDEMCLLLKESGEGFVGFSEGEDYIKWKKFRWSMKDDNIIYLRNKNKNYEYIIKSPKMRDLCLEIDGKEITFKRDSFPINKTVKLTNDKDWLITKWINPFGHIIFKSNTFTLEFDDENFKPRKEYSGTWTIEDDTHISGMLRTPDNPDEEFPFTWEVLVLNPEDLYIDVDGEEWDMENSEFYN